jgi:S-adenosylmethionine/arginine decarboxylase-like enzyme
MKGFVSSQGMKTEAGPIVSYILDEGNRGMTAACLINTSHLAFHVWDEVDPPLLQFDFYTCGELKVGEVLKHIDRGFGLLKSKHENMVLDRSEKITVKRQFLKNTDVLVMIMWHIIGIAAIFALGYWVGKYVRIKKFKWRIKI